MTTEEIKAIQDIQGTAGFRVIESLLVKSIAELDSVSKIDLDKPNIEAKAVGRSLAVKWCTDIKNEINLSVIPEKNKRRTHE